jgi:hypothetical protein
MEIGTSPPFGWSGLDKAAGLHINLKQQLSVHQRLLLICRLPPIGHQPHFVSEMEGQQCPLSTTCQGGH